MRKRLKTKPIDKNLVFGLRRSPVRSPADGSLKLVEVAWETPCNVCTFVKTANTVQCVQFCQRKHSVLLRGRTFQLRILNRD